MNKENPMMAKPRIRTESLEGLVSRYSDFGDFCKIIRTAGFIDGIPNLSMEHFEVARDLQAYSIEELGNIHDGVHGTYSEQTHIVTIDMGNPVDLSVCVVRHDETKLTKEEIFEEALGYLDEIKLTCHGEVWDMDFMRENGLIKSTYRK
jgi:hypothetical protein